MRHFRNRLLAYLAAMALAYVPGALVAQSFEWQTATPASQGMSEEKLKAWQQDIAGRKTAGLLVIRNDRIVLEWYAEGQSVTKTHYTASLAKALVGGVSCAVAMTDGKIALDDPAARYIPQWQGDARKSKITIRQLGSHTSGLEDSSVSGIAHTQEPGWKGEFWKRLEVPNDAFTISRDRTPVTFEPGTDWAYSNPGIAMLTYAVTAAIQDGPHKDVRTLLKERVMRPIGVADNEWSVGYGKTYTVDGLPLVGSWGGGAFTARASARVGRLMLREGDWEGKQIVSKESVRATTADSGTPGTNGIGWWSNNQGQYSKLQKDAYWGAGAGNQILLVVPSLKLIMVRNGGALSDQDDRSIVYTYLFEPLMGAIQGEGGAGKGSKPLKVEKKATKAPYPPSSVIAGIEWAPKEKIIRKARGGDNWPLTWGDDGHQYAAYGDANGFEPFLKEKLSMGFARVEGGPNDFLGVNVRSSTFERKGDGMHGKKTSGMLMVDGVLYALVRNAENSQVIWSNDHGQTWTWSDWKFTKSMGCPTFLNFGKNYAGARDEFVYIYSLDHDSAYEAADRMILARVPKSKIKEPGAYEYLKSVHAGQPIWTKNIEERGAAFDHPGNCYRSGVTYNAGLKRYLWCQVLPHSTHAQGPRFQGGIGVYDAPEPWGPWTTVFFTDAWDVGPGETNSFPTKWMSSDGKTMHLVFSGDDHFSVREAKLTLK